MSKEIIIYYILISVFRYKNGSYDYFMYACPHSLLCMLTPCVKYTLIKRCNGSLIWKSGLSYIWELAILGQNYVSANRMKNGR